MLTDASRIPPYPTSIMHRTREHHAIEEHFVIQSLRACYIG